MGVPMTYLKSAPTTTQTIVPQVTPVPTKSFQTRADLIRDCGEPEQETTQEMGFFATSFKEDCFLVGGGRDAFDRRLQFPDGKLCKVAYLDPDGNVIRTF